MVSLTQLVSFPASSLNLAYTVAVVLDCPRVHVLFEVAYVSHVPSAEHPEVFVIYISDAFVAAKVRFGVLDEICVPPSIVIDGDVGAVLS